MLVFAIIDMRLVARPSARRRSRNVHPARGRRALHRGSARRRRRNSRATSGSTSASEMLAMSERPSAEESSALGRVGPLLRFARAWPGFRAAGDRVGSVLASTRGEQSSRLYQSVGVMADCESWSARAHFWLRMYPLPAGRQRGCVMDTNRSPYPLQLTGELSPQLSRWLWLVKWLLAIPHFIVLFFLWIAFVGVTVLAFFAVLFMGRYPRGLFDLTSACSVGPGASASTATAHSALTDTRHSRSRTCPIIRLVSRSSTPSRYREVSCWSSGSSLCRTTLSSRSSSEAAGRRGQGPTTSCGKPEAWLACWSCSPESCCSSPAATRGLSTTSCSG